ncbi:MAG: restriction endonuclease, partial [Proteobacteria bacterium]|nr:restriction endonuclease [Pseudomonadota bacterium]
MSRTQISDSSAWPSLALEGNLIASAAVAKIAAPEDNAAARKSYGIRQGLSIREEMATAFRVGQSHYNEFAQLHNPSPQKTRTFIRNFLKEAFGFDDLEISDGPIAFIGGERVPIVVVPPSEEKLDRCSETLSTERQLSPALALQNYLNKHDEALWGLVSNGRQIWLMRDNASLTRPAYIEADIEQIFTNEDFSSFCVQWLLIHRTRFGVKGALATDCELER